MSFGAKFRFLREAKGLPRAGIDELFQLTPGTVSNWENGYREPEEELLPDLARFFGVRKIYGNEVHVTDRRPVFGYNRRRKHFSPGLRLTLQQPERTKKG